MLFNSYVFIFGLLPTAVTGFFPIGMSQTVSSMPGTPTTDPALGRALCALTGQLPPIGSVVAR